MDTDNLLFGVFGVVVAALVGAAMFWISPPGSIKATARRPLRLALTVSILVIAELLICAGQGLAVATALPIIVLLFRWLGRR